MSFPAPGSDVLVTCTKSGCILVLDIVLREGDWQMVMHRLDVDGIKARFNGKCCPGCHGPSCEYRPLVGPLFIPRPLSANPEER